MSLSSSTVAANDAVSAAERNLLRRDLLRSGADYAVSGGSANAQTLSIDAQYTAYAAGDLIKFKAGFTNTGACTMTINSIAGGAKAIQKQGVALAGGEIVKDDIVTIVYDGTNFQLKDSGRMVGEMTIWTTDTAPAGWLLCYGQAVSRTTYAALFSIISTAFGVGDNSTTFNLPDMRGRFPLGQDDMGGSSANRVTHANADTVGLAEGAESHTLTEAEMPAHTHSISGNTTTSDAGPNWGIKSSSGSGTTGSTGSGQAHNIMNPYLTVNFIIKF